MKLKIQQMEKQFVNNTSAFIENELAGFVEQIQLSVIGKLRKHPELFEITSDSELWKQLQSITLTKCCKRATTVVTVENSPTADGFRGDITNKCLALTPKGKQCSISRSTRKDTVDSELCFKHNQSVAKGKKVIKVTDAEGVDSFFKKKRQDPDKRKFNNFKKKTVVTPDDLIVEPAKRVTLELPSKLEEFDVVAEVNIVDKGEYYEDSIGNQYSKKTGDPIVEKT